jgi:hypothetical protein
MTDPRKSDAQLDAEAAAPPRDLDAAIALHRLLYQDDLFFAKMHQRDGDYGIGVPFNPIFAGFLDEWYATTLWHRAYQRINLGLYARALVNLVIRQQYSVDMARLRLQLPDAERTDRTLTSALTAIERRMDTQLEPEPQQRTPAEWMGRPHEHREPGGPLPDECPQCRRLDNPAYDGV